MKPAARNRKDNKKNEERDVTLLIEMLNDPASKKGEELRQAFHAEFGYPFQAARARTAFDTWMNSSHTLDG